MLRPVRRRALSDEVFEQIRDQIVNGTLRAGSPLPAERVLCDALGVNRGAVREALRRLQQARLVSVRHGGTSRVLDFRTHAGLDLLPELLLAGPGGIDPAVLGSLLEMRSAVAPDTARLAAERSGPEVAAKLDAVVDAMRGAEDDPARLQDLAAAFWSLLVEGSQNIAYRLAYNSMRAVYDHCRALFTSVLSRETGDVALHAELAEAVRVQDAARAEEIARELVRRGEEDVKQALGRAARAGSSGPAPARSSRGRAPRRTR
jgi:DNA-binding FadR family transcriptional regulator